MKKIMLISISILVLFLFSGCTSKVEKIKPLDTKEHHIYEICIEKNPKVIAHDFLPFIIKQFKRYNIESKIYNEMIPDSCLYSLKYSANKHWDIVMYFRAASLEIYHKNKLIASVEYETQNGLDMSKFESLEKKFTPIIDKLLEGHTPPLKEEVLARKRELNLDEEPSNKNTGLESKLVEIKKLYENGVITADEHDNKRRQLLSEY